MGAATGFEFCPLNIFVIKTIEKTKPNPKEKFFKYCKLYKSL